MICIPGKKQLVGYKFIPCGSGCQELIFQQHLPFSQLAVVFAELLISENALVLPSFPCCSQSFL